MNAIRRAAFAASAVVITLVGAALVTAPLAFARSEPAAAHQACDTPGPELAVAGHVACSKGRADAGLLAFNRR
jgi:hypothetical protein